MPFRPRHQPKIARDAKEVTAFERNNKLIYSGALAKQWALRGANGEYYVQPIEPLFVSPEGIGIDMNHERFKQGLEQIFVYAVRYGALTAAWTINSNTVVVNPCEINGANRDTVETVTLYIWSPTGASPTNVVLAQDDVVAYLPNPDGLTGFLLPTPRRQGMFAVQMFKTGGSAGKVNAPCSFTYTVKDLAANELGTDVSPERNRPAVGPFVAPTNEDYGVGFYDGANFKLWDANEALDSAGCSS